MADGLNRVMLLGNLGADPELRFTQAGQAVLNMRLATTESYLDKDKVRRERTDWHNVVVWGKRGEALANILRKGSSVFVEGALRTSSYDDREGNKRYKTEIVAQNILLTGGRGQAGDHASDDGGEQGAGDAGEYDGRAAAPAGEGGYARSAARAPGPASASRAAPSPAKGGKKQYSGPVADDRNLDGPGGNPDVKFMPRDWDASDDFKGRQFSECSPEFLDMLAESLEWSGKNPRPGKEQYVQRNLDDAARAAGWAARLRRGGRGAPAGASSAEDLGDYGGGSAGGDDDIPF